MIDNQLPSGKFDAVILAVAHDEFRYIDLNQLKNDICVVYDVKGFLPRETVDGRL